MLSRFGAVCCIVLTVSCGLNRFILVKSTGCVGLETICDVTVGCVTLGCALGVDVTFGVSVTVGVDVLPDCVEIVEDASCFCLASFAFCIWDWIISWIVIKLMLIN